MDYGQVKAFAHENAPHECGHMVVLLKAGRFSVMSFLPHEKGVSDKKSGVLITRAKTDLTSGDCPFLAAGMIGELVARGDFSEDRVTDDRRQVKELCGQTLEAYASEVYGIIRENLLFFSMLNAEVEKKICKVMHDEVAFLSPEKWSKLPEEIPIMKLADVEEIHEKAQSKLAEFAKSATKSQAPL